MSISSTGFAVQRIPLQVSGVYIHNESRVRHDDKLGQEEDDRQVIPRGDRHEHTTEQGLNCGRQENYGGHFQQGGPTLQSTDQQKTCVKGNMLKMKYKYFLLIISCCQLLSGRCFRSIIYLKEKGLLKGFMATNPLHGSSLSESEKRESKILNSWPLD